MEGVSVSEDATCKGKLGNLVEVTLMARLSRETARGRVAKEKIEKLLRKECLDETWRADFLSGPVNPVKQPALRDDLPQVAVEQLL